MNLLVHSFREMSSYPLEIPVFVVFVIQNRVTPQIQEILELDPYPLNLKRLCLDPVIAYGFRIDINCLLNSRFYEIKENLNPTS